jgi:transmembrane sensor
MTGRSAIEGEPKANPQGKTDAGGPGDGTTAEQARKWLIYLYSGEATDAGRQRFSAWLQKSPEHARAYRRSEKAWRGLTMAGAAGLFQSVARAPAGQATVTVLPDRRRSALKPSKPRWKLPASIAATVLIALAAGIWYQQPAPVTTTRYTSETAEIKTVVLEDGSQVTLGASSAIVASFGHAQRHVKLVKGAAYFDIAPQPERAFVVAAATTEIRVVGTEFDVRKGPNDVRISVAEGVVEVGTVPVPATAENQPHVQQDESPDRTRLLAGQQVAATLGGKLGEVQPFDRDAALGWREGKLLFMDARLEDVIADVNRYRNEKILLADDKLKDIRISIVVPANETDRLLVGLEATYPVQINKSPIGILVKSKH